MDVFIHGGKCCGIKHIFDIGYTPSELKSRKFRSKGIGRDEGTGYMNSTLNFYTDPAPKETALERMKRIINFIQRKRPSGLIEVVTAGVQTAHWKQSLLDLGFVNVTKARNSNSGLDIYVWHLAYRRSS